MKLKFILLPLVVFTTLAFAVIQIPDVVIHGKKNHGQATKGLIKNLPIQVVTAKQKNILQPRNLSELLQKTTNILVRNFDGIRADISMRGFGDNAAQNVLILLNGQPLANPDLGIPDINLLPVASISQIEILPNSYGVLYGDQAVGGVINIITQVPKKDFAQLDMLYGSFNTYNFHGDIAKTYTNGFGYDVSAAHFKSDHYRDHNAERKNNAVLNFNYHNQETDAYLEYQDVAQKLQLAGALTAEQVQQNRRQAKNNADQSNTHNRLLLIGLKQQLSSGWYLKMDGSAMLGKNDGILDVGNTLYNFKADRYNYFFRPEFLGTTNFYKFTLKPILGVEIKNAAYDYKSTAYASDDIQVQMAMFGQLGVELTPKLEVVGGFRMAKNEANIDHDNIQQSESNNVTPFTLGLNYTLNNVWHFYIRRAGNYRFAKVDELISTLNNEALKPQTGIAYEAGFGFNKYDLGWHLQLFQLDLTNEIAYIPLLNTPYGFGYNENLDRTRRRGITTDLHYAITSAWNILGGITYVQPKFLSGEYKNNIIPNVPRTVANLGADYKFKQHWHMFANVNYIGERFASNDVGNQDLLNGYALLNAGISCTYKNARLTAKLNNITDKKYNSATVMKYNQQGAPELFYYPAAGINGDVVLAVQL